MLDKLEMFAALATERHFGRAAQRIGITQPSLSSGIKQLEDQLGVQLVFRGSRFGGLTPEGERALVWARRILRDARQLRDEMRSPEGGVTGLVRLAVIPTALTCAARLTARLTARHPGIRVQVVQAAAERIVTMLDTLEADAGLSYVGGASAGGGAGRFDALPLHEERYMLVCPAGSPHAARTTMPWAALAGERLGLLTPDMQNRRILDGHLARAGVVPEAVIEANSTVVLVAHVAFGGGLTVLPEDVAGFAAAGQPLALIPMERQMPGPQVGLLTPGRELRTGALEALLGVARTGHDAGQGGRPVADPVTDPVTGPVAGPVAED